jgi:peptidyl-prolyl cis-trans isomerase D
MLKIMRDSFQHLKWILVIIVGIFIVFTFTDLGGAGARNRDAGVGYAARVNGQTVSVLEYQRALSNATRMYEQMYQQPITPEMQDSLGLKKQVLDSLVDQQLLMQQADRLHLRATAEDVRRKILSLPAFNPDGKFIGEDLYVRYVTGQLGYGTPAEFEDDVQRQLTLEKMDSALSNSIVVSPKAAESEYRRITENAKIKYVLYPAARELSAVTVTPAEVEQFYAANKSRYAHGEQRAVKYLLADTGRIRSQINPSEQDLLTRYNASKEDFKTKDSAHILHILVKVDPSAAPDVDAAASAKAQSIVQQLRAGADFGAVARVNSGDPSSAGNGGDMGFVERGVTVPAFDQAAFSIPLNQVSDPIRTKEFGYHIIKVLERRPAGYRTFAEVRPQLLAQYADQLSKDQARDEITRIAARLQEKKPKTADEFSAMASDKVSSNDTQWFGKTDAVQGIGNNPPLTNWAFAAKTGDVGDIIGTQRGPAIPYLYGVRPADVSPLADIRAKVEADARQAKARTLAAQKLAAAMSAGSVSDIGAKIGTPPAETTVTRAGTVSGLNGDASALVDAAIAAKVGDVKGPITVGDGAIAFQVLDQKKVDAKMLTDNMGSYMDMMRQQEARNLRASLLQRLRKDSKVEVNPTLVQPAQQQSQRGQSRA